MPINYKDYPENWEKIAERIKKKNDYKCERCGHIHEVKTGYVLTVHHLDGDKTNSAEWNLAVLCQRCHLHVQAKVKMEQMFFDFLEVSDWFLPHLRGYKNYMEKIKKELDND